MNDMKQLDRHPSEEDLLLAIDGELPQRAAAKVEAHLAGCWSCRARKQKLEDAIGAFVRVHVETMEEQIPPADGPRALLKARMDQLASTQAERVSGGAWFHGISQKPALAGVTLTLGLVLAIYFAGHMIVRPQVGHAATVAAPDPKLTPGATLLLNRGEICRGPSSKNGIVPVALQRRVFEEYGIAGADPRAYEVDYLVTPALGGADDIHNLWPHSHASTIWNAEVKDALEDRLRNLVCAGQIDLSTAQHDIATNWIDAYKKYFHTDQPLTDAR